ncbi:MAG: DoxX family protein [Ferruginibacter sp.]
MLQKIIQTNNNKAAAVLRIVLGLVLFPHGAQKLLGWFGGFGFSGTMNYFTGTVHLPWIIALLVILIEFIGSLMLIIGMATRVAALLIIINFIGVILTAHLANGFFINWLGNQKGEGYEYHLLIIGMAASLLISGAGAFSVDRVMSKEKLSMPLR